MNDVELTLTWSPDLVAQRNALKHFLFFVMQSRRLDKWELTRPEDIGTVISRCGEVASMQLVQR
jgi:hypothetical protein